MSSGRGEGVRPEIRVPRLRAFRCIETRLCTRVHGATERSRSRGAGRRACVLQRIRARSGRPNLTRSHPPSLLTLSARTIRESALFGKGDRLLVAVSGGPDSMALLHVLALLRGRLGYELVAHGVDHGLRPDAPTELDLAADLARALEVPMARTRVRIAPGGNLQARARDARYEVLRKAARSAGACVLATGHHADDRAETVIIRLLRGAGPRGLAVLPPRAGDLVRPLIRARRWDIEAHLARHAIAHAFDPSNANPRFLRVRVRKDLLPLLEQLSPSIVAHLCALADQLAPLVTTRPGASAATGLEAHIDTLPRATRDALLKLERGKSPSARVKLPRGLVAHYDRAQVSVVIAREPLDPLTASRRKLNVGTEG